MIIGSKLLPIIMTKIGGGGKSIYEYFAYLQKKLGGGGHLPPVPYPPPVHGFHSMLKDNVEDIKRYL